MNPDTLPIIESLAAGKCPNTGEYLPADDSVQQSNVVRALFDALEILRKEAKRPFNQGANWAIEDEARLAAGHAAGQTDTELAALLGRTANAVHIRLVRLGLRDG